MGLISAHALFCTLLLGLILEQEFEDMTGGQIGSQIIKRAVFLPLGTGAVGFATGGEALHLRGAQQVWGHHELSQEGRLAVAQRQGRRACEIEYLSHY